MEVDGPALDALQEATHAQLRARKLGKIAATIPKVQPNAPVPESMLHENLAHHPMSSLIQTNHLRILINTQNGFFGGIFTSVPTGGAQMKFMK